MSTTATTNQYLLTASIAADGSLQLSGADLIDDVIETPRGQDAIVVIKDIAGQHLYGAEIPIGGGQTQCWQRDISKGQTQRVFSVVNADIVNIVFAAQTSDNAKVKYGPVITIKPKG